MRPGRKTRRKNSWLALSLSQSRRMSIDLDFFGLTEEVARSMAHSLSTNRRGGDCWGWPRLVLFRVSVSSTNTCPPPKAAAYCHRRYHHGYALAVGMEGSVVGDRGG
jgi:hypothetical protein